MTIANRAHLEDLLPAIAEFEQREPESYPAASVAALYEAGVISGPLPPELGGSAWRLPDAVRAIESLSAVSPSTALMMAMPLGLAGICGLGADIAPSSHRAAWADQVERVASDYGRGLIYAACNSEKGAGGSLAATQTIATKSPDGGFRISGEKILASSGKYASTFFSTAKVSPEELPGAGIVEFFYVPVDAPGVAIQQDWDGFGMRPTESHTVRFTDALTREIMGFPDFINVVQPLQYWFCLFAAIPLGCAKAILKATGSPAPQSAALRVRLTDATMKYESLRAYLLETSEAFQPGPNPEYAARVLRTKTYVSQEATKLCAELFALGGGRNYRRNSPVARMLADSFAGTSLRPPLALALDQLVENFTLGEAGE